MAAWLFPAFATSAITTLLRLSNLSKNVAWIVLVGLTLLNNIEERAQSDAAHVSSASDCGVLGRMGGLDVGSTECSPSSS